uniref:Uncharacterized protein n=1 Tax=Florenciella parvula TaxID=236787 RepID=A0A7S2CEE7_9STRA|mmetsp:Transcript_27831/g.57106  ORF Transcript_27831/g.57106 Transcript_27831/m.57106 type:complete len:143 (+) Transcript_27831:50-478(+)|eukprot:CAMPEP_0182531150 /NCGR_PEP_ID=MMETSP1323-20130603/8134_1 /TAXON_ID=236787 /ORGANISM="Florenciella parvula, Strain RCC1693" /LENGTH=142 /DNA_ID=CAMNT_0024740641 /DNA_START=47 /DNA_END=475 /DNA_ORIENTATION=-
MKLLLTLLTVASAAAFAPKALPRASFNRAVTPRAVPVALVDVAAGAAAAAVLSSQPMDTSMLSNMANVPMMVSATKYETKEGIYGEYQVEVKEQAVDDARSTFKSAKATKKGKNKYVAVLGVLLVGSFLIPMLQYFWYVRED